METSRISAEFRETKIFDPRDPATGTVGAELLDATVVRRGDQWWMYLAGQAAGYGAPQIFSASLPAGAPLSASGWTVTRTPDSAIAPLAGQQASRDWDGNGGRHCPAYVRGWDPQRQQWVERIYYAGGAQNVWGPYTIGFLEWDGECWIEQAEPVFIATEDWEHGSVYEPNFIYHDGKWKLWYVAGSNYENYLIHGYAESEGSHELDSAQDLRSAGDEDVRLLCPATGRCVRRDLRAGLGRGKPRTA